MEKRTSPTSWAVVLLIVLVCVGIAAIGSYLITHAGRTSAGTCTPTNVRVGSDVRILGEGIVYYDGAMIGALDKNGVVKWNYSAGINAEYNVGPGGIATWTTSSLSFINKDTGDTLYSSVTTMPVLSAVVGPQYAAVMLGSESAAQMRIYELTGREIDQIDLSGKTVLDYGFFSNGALLWVMVLDSNGTVPTCNIQTYRPGKEIVGSIHDNEQLMYSVVFQSSYFCCAGDTFLKVYDYTGKEDRTRRRKVYGWYMAALDESVADDPLMVFVPNAQYDSQGAMQDVRMIRSNMDQQVRMPYGCQSLIARNDRVYGFSTEGYVAIATQGRQKVSAYALPMLFDKVYGVTSDNMAILGNGNIIYILNLS